MGKRGYAAASAFCFISILIQSGCSSSTTTSQDSLSLQNDGAPAVDDATAQVRSAVSGLKNVIAWRDIPAGKYLLAEYKQTIFLRQNHQEIEATYDHTMKDFGKIAEGDTVQVSEPELPPAMGYTSSLALALPTRIDASGTAAPAFGGYVYYEPYFSHGTSDAEPYWTWHSHDNASRGFNLFSVCRDDLLVRGGGKPFYRGYLKGFSEDRGNFYGWVQKSSQMAGVISVTLYVQDAASGSDSGLSLITAQYIDLSQIGR